VQAEAETWDRRQRRLSLRSFRSRGLAAGLLSSALVLVTVSAGHAQLAITEVMSQSSTNLGSITVPSRSDFWELTNFGTNTIAIDGYSFSDRDSDPASRVSEPFRNCFIGPGESIILVRTDEITNRQGFFEWWGANNLRPTLQVRMYPRRPGFDPEIDSVQLFDRNGELIDRVDFGRALRGHTFVYDAVTAEFGTFSALGRNGAFKAVLADDVGSPGGTTGPVPLSIVEQPVSVTQDAGLDVEFSVRATGLPRPSYQWLLNETALPGARTSRLILTSVQPEDAGDYTVRVFNGVNTVTSQTATLIVNTQPTPARIVTPPVDALVFEGQTAVFTAKARGYPPPTFQWQANSVDIPGAINNRLELPGAELAWSGTRYTVRIENSSGSVSASAQLEVTRRPRLNITEVMASVAGGTGSSHNDWFELTNFDTDPVKLFGYRFSDRYSFEASYVITNAVVIAPGESIIFVERLTREEFLQWWGRDRLPPGVQVITYSGLGFSSLGDIINLWNGAETDPYSPLLSVGFLESTPGVSMRFIPPDYYFVEDGVLGADGAFGAENGDDIGSPGFLANPPPRFVRVTHDGANVLLTCRVIDGKSYVLRSCADLAERTWSTLGTYVASDFVITIPLTDSSLAQDFFLIIEVP
jgi:hypothetical protein